jgi:hypothetical protein
MEFTMRKRQSEKKRSDVLYYRVDRDIYRFYVSQALEAHPSYKSAFSGDEGKGLESGSYDE